MLALAQVALVQVSLAHGALRGPLRWSLHGMHAKVPRPQLTLGSAWAAVRACVHTYP